MIRLNASRLFGLAAAITLAVGLVGCGAEKTASVDTVDTAENDRVMDRVVRLALAEHDRLVAEADAAAAAESVPLDGLTEAQKRRRGNFVAWSMQEQDRAAEYVGLARDCDQYAMLDPSAERKAMWVVRARVCRAKALMYSERSRYFAMLADRQRNAAMYVEVVRGYDGDAAMRKLPPRQTPEQAVLPRPDDLASAE